MRKFVSILVAVILISNVLATPCFAQDVWRKLGRGVANTLTGIVEVPKNIYLTSKNENVLKGMTLGLGKGLIMGIKRTAAGLYEAITFPIPVPANYEPIVEPEFVFDEWE